MKHKIKKSKYKPMRLVFAFSCLLGLAAQPVFAQRFDKLNDRFSNKLNDHSQNKSILLGYYPANYLMASTTASLRIQNQFMGMGDKLCIWVEGEYANEPSLRGTKQFPTDNVSTSSTTNASASLSDRLEAKGFTAILTNDSTFNTNITAIEMQYYPAQKATALFIPMPTNAILYNAYKIKLMYNEKNIANINKLYLVPNFVMPELVSTTNEIKIDNASKLVGGQAPFQYYWMEYSNGRGKMISSGSVDELSKLPTIKTEDKDATYSLMIKDANYLVSNQFISTKASNLPSVGILNNRNIKVKIYPNPTTSELYVQFDKPVSTSLNDRQNPEANNQQLSYTITDLLGKEILKGNLNTADLKTIAVQALAQGSFMLSITNSKDSSLLYQNKFVKL
jgi:hypothetical protein